MLTSLSVAVLVAASPDVLVVSGVESAKVKALFPAGRQPVDASAIHGYLFARGMLDFQAFGAFSDPPIPEWPAALKSVWAEGLASCAEIAGPSPWSTKVLPGARCCGQRLALHLWGKYLEAQRADQVYVVEVDDAPKGASVYGSRYGAASVEKIELDEKGAAGASGDLVKTVVATLLKGEGGKGKRVMVPRMFDAVAGDPWKAPPELKPLELKKKCDALPATLKFKAESPTATALSSRWSTAAPGKGAALECSLSFTSHFELPSSDPMMAAMGPLEVVTSVLRCGPHTAATELMKGLRAGPRPPMEVITTELAQALASRICK